MSSSTEQKPSRDDSQSDDLPIGSLQDWKDRQPLPLLDLRSLEDYQSCSVAGSVHIPLSEVKQRSYELPPRQNAFAVLVQKSDQEEALALIREFFLCRDDNEGAKRRRRAQKPWKAPLVIVADEATWNQAKELGILKTDTISQGAFQPLPRLWQPDSMVKEVLLPLLAKRLETNITNNKQREIWDLGAGSGRHVCFLAEELKAVKCSKNNATTNFCVVGMDQRYRSVSPEEQEECVFWKRRGVEDVTRCVSVQFGKTQPEHEKWFEKETGARSVLCLFLVRFWNKSLMEFLAQSRLVEEGTLIAVSQFAKASMGAKWEFEHPKEKHVLERDELSQMFCAETGWSILHDNIVQDSDHGRTLINFVAAKT